MTLVSRIANLALVAGILFLAPSGRPLQAQAVLTMAASDIRPGMKGYGRTVFQGGKIERFEFEVLGVSKNGGGPLLAPGRGLILVRASGGPLADTGIISGMSGSPCYIDGKLVGALSIGFPFEKEPIGGITPIGDMLDQLKEVQESAGPRTPLILPKLEPPKVLKSAMQGIMISNQELLGGLGLGSENGRPLDLPVVGAFGPEAQGFLKGFPFSFNTAPAISSGASADASPIEPGGMAAIMLVQGDLELAASGTISYISGKKILLFGHQLFNLGFVDLPLWSASVNVTVASYNSSFKLTQPVAPIGALRLDRGTGIAGILGAEARMVPFRVGLNLGGKRTLNFRFELMDHPLLMPNLAAGVLMQTLNAHVRGMGLQSLSLQGNIKITGQAPILIENVTADLSSGRLANYVGSMLQALELNPFERPQIEGISLTVKAEERLDLTTIAGARLMKARVKRGETLPVVVTLQNIQGVRETATFNIQVPHSAQPGKAQLLVGDGLSLIATDPDERAVDVSSLGDVVRLLNGALRNNHAYALLVQAQTGAGLRGARLEGIPPTIGAQMMADGMIADNKLHRRFLGRGVLPLDREVRGLLTLDVEIE